MTLGSVLFRVSHTRLAGATVRFVFARAVWLLPVRFVVKTPRVVVFPHPRPVDSPHLLVVPRRAIRGVRTVTAADRPWLDEAWRLGREQALAAGVPAVLVFNGGRWQDVPQLHGHVLPAERFGISGAGLDETPLFEVVEHPQPARAGHLAFRFDDAGAAFDLARDLARENVTGGRGFSFVLEPGPCVAHLLWGSRTDAPRTA